MHDAPELGRFTVMTGHYGCGKTNLSINLALELARTHDEVMLVDLDIVNPYFRSSDYTGMLEARGVTVIAPAFAGTTLDTPSLSPEISRAFESDGAVIFDVGGDDVGATALGRFARDIEKLEYDLLYVVNRYRNLTTTPEEAARLLGEIEGACHLKATGVVNNSHLQSETTLQTVLDSMPFARETAACLGLPLRFTTVPAAIAGQRSDVQGSATHIENAYPIEVYVRPPWDESAPADEEVNP